MNILFLLIDFSKNSDHLYKELVYKFRDCGHNVYVGTITEKKYKIPTSLQEEDGIKVLRVQTGNLFEVGFIEKGITTLTLGRTLKNEVQKHFKNIPFDLVIHHTPPITFDSVVSEITRISKAKSYLILRDIFPQNAVDLGILKNKLLFKYFRKVERKLYKDSDFIGCMSQENINYIRAHNPDVDHAKLHILRNWGKIRPPLKVKKKDIRKKYGFSNDDFIAVFGGNMGRPQGLEFLLKLAEEYRESKNIKFLMVGKGCEKPKLMELAKNKGLKNVIFLDFIPRVDYEKLIAACDIGIVSLHSSFTIPNIPYKTVDYCKLSLPILACTDTNTDYPKILEKEAKAGLASIYGDIEGYKRNFEILLTNRELRQKMSISGRKYYEEYLGVDLAYKTITDKVNSVM